MQPFEYASPKTVKEALALLGAGWEDAALLAGGTDLLSLMKDSVVTPKRVVNLKDIAALKGITKTAAGLRIGALATVDEVLTSALVKASYPALTAAAQGVSSAQIRNMGTFGGDLCQRPRCWFFRAGFGLIAKHEGKDLAVEGDNRYHAIFGDGPARFVSASSFAPALIALGAKVKIASSEGTREVEAAKFFVAPASSAEREVALKPNEIVTEVVIPSAVTKNATYEVRQKDALDWPLATASVALTMKGTAVASARIVLGHVAPAPYVSEAAAAVVAGKAITAELASEAGKAAVAAGVASILVPYPHAVDDHQTSNARFLSNAGAAVLVPQTELDPERLALFRTLSREQLLQMAEQARALAKPDATAVVAEICADLANARKP